MQLFLVYRQQTQAYEFRNHGYSWKGYSRGQDLLRIEKKRQDQLQRDMERSYWRRVHIPPPGPDHKVPMLQHQIGDDDRVWK